MTAWLLPWTIKLFQNGIYSGRKEFTEGFRMERNLKGEDLGLVDIHIKVKDSRAIVAVFCLRLCRTA